VGRGKLITIEGIDGAGKSTLARSLAEELSSRGLTVELLREPGGVDLSERIRTLVKDPSLSISPRAEALLYAAARAQLVHELLEPLLNERDVLLLDRFIDSSLAYQGAGRGLGVDNVLAINRFATDGLEADLTLLLRIPPADARSRQAARDTSPDRLESEGESFFAAISSSYDDLARSEPNRIHPIDATQPPDRLLAEALSLLSHLLPASFRGSAA
jgi:dTMP kinase